MQKFLDQFNLTPYMALNFEQFIFRMADDMIEGYSGGNWGTMTVGKVVILLIPHDGERITLNNKVMGGTVETDRVTASAAFTSIVVNWFWNMLTESMSDIENQSFNGFHYDLRDEVYSDDPEHTINTSDYFSFTD